MKYEQFYILSALLCLNEMDPMLAKPIFGDIIGESHGVVAHNNTPEGFVSSEHVHIFHKEQSLYTGIKGQCVEFARRWLILKKDLSFESIEYAKDLWNFSSFFCIHDQSKKVDIKKFKNANTTEPPQIGDLLIYDTSAAVITGHVAVVTDLKDNIVFLAEQNYVPGYWNHSSYSRAVLLNKKASMLSLDDIGIIGWIRLE